MNLEKFILFLFYGLVFMGGTLFIVFVALFIKMLFSPATMTEKEKEDDDDAAVAAVLAASCCGSFFDE